MFMFRQDEIYRAANDPGVENEDLANLIAEKENAAREQKLAGRTPSDPLEFLKSSEYNVRTQYPKTERKQIDLEESNDDEEGPIDTLDELEAILSKTVEPKAKSIVSDEASDDLPEDLILENILRKQSTPEQIQTALLTYLNDNQPLPLDDEDEIPPEEDVPPAQEFLAKMKAAYPNPRVDLYEAGIVNYVKSKHLRQAMIIFADMKQQGLTASPETYSEIIEGYFSNFDLLAAENLSQEMKTLYPDSTPPTFGFLQVKE
jgi:hypothetical protein